MLVAGVTYHLHSHLETTLLQGTDITSSPHSSSADTRGHFKQLYQSHCPPSLHEVFTDEIGIRALSFRFFLLEAVIQQQGNKT